MDATAIYGGTAGQWGRRPINLDEMEIMVVSRKAESGELFLLPRR
jgi:hypothetical protein